MKFEYIARTPKGEIQSGTVETSSYEAAVEILQRHKLIVTSLRSVEEKKGMIGEFRIPLPFKRINLRDISIFSRQLAILFSSEVPLVEALRTMGNQTEKAAFKEKIFKIADDVDSGTAFSKAIAKYPEVFSTFYVNLIRAGEVSGKLSESLEHLADHHERQYEMMGKIKGAMYYPAFIFVALILAVAIMFIFVIPAITSILVESQQSLPVITRAIIGLTNFLRQWGWILFSLLAVGLVFFLRWRSGPKGRKIWDKYIIRLPILGKIFIKIALSRFSSNLSTLIKGGLPISRAMEITAEVVGNETYKEIILEAEEGIRRGEFISATFKMKKEIPPLVTQMILIGEKTGKLPAVLENLSQFYQKEVERITENLVNLIEPIMILVIGVGVGFIVVGVIMPIYQIAGTVF